MNPFYILDNYREEINIINRKQKMKTLTYKIKIISLSSAWSFIKKSYILNTSWQYIFHFFVAVAVATLKYLSLFFCSFTFESHGKWQSLSYISFREELLWVVTFHKLLCLIFKKCNCRFSVTFFLFLSFFYRILF